LEVERNFSGMKFVRPTTEIPNLFYLDTPLLPYSGDVYSIQKYVIKFVGDLQQVGGFLRVFRSPPLKYT
jgi:hypothetical protein